jgi:hypothetical protein
MKRKCPPPPTRLPTRTPPATASPGTRWACPRPS